jgi:hypothetical protein
LLISVAEPSLSTIHSGMRNHVSTQLISSLNIPPRVSQSRIRPTERFLHSSICVFSTITWYNTSPSRVCAPLSSHALPRPASAYGETDSGMTIEPCSSGQPASGRNGTCKDPRDEKPHVPKGWASGPLRWADYPRR